MKKLSILALATLLCGVAFAGGYGYDHDEDGNVTVRLTDGQTITNSIQFNKDATQNSGAYLNNASAGDVSRWSQGMGNSASNSFNGANNAMSTELDNVAAKGDIKIAVKHNQTLGCLKQVNKNSTQNATANMSNVGGVASVKDNSVGISNGASNDFNSGINYVGITADGLTAGGNVSLHAAPCTNGGCTTQSIANIEQKNYSSAQTANATVNMATVDGSACATCGRVGDVADHSVGINNAASNSFNTLGNIANYRMTDVTAGSRMGH